MSNLSRAEGDVDKLVQQHFFPTETNGVFVDVGAARPDFLSISSLYRELGWRVLAIEPNPIFCQRYRELGYEILQYACGDHDEDDVPFSVVDSHGSAYYNGAVTYESFSSLGIKDNYATLKSNLDVTTIKVNLRRLDTLLASHDVRHVDIVSVDVEGWELEVLSGLTFRMYQPRVLIIENLFNSDTYPSFMAERGYDLWRQLPPNDVYVRRSPANLLDRAQAALHRLFRNR